MRTLALLAFIAIISGCTSISSKPVFKTEASAIRGYDTVAYFTEDKAVKGSPEFTVDYNGATWHFSSEQNQELFKAQPEKYAPQYGGYCAYAMANNFVVSTDPNAYTVYKDKLYLNYSIGVRKTWLKNIDAHIESADKNWANKSAK